MTTLTGSQPTSPAAAATWGRARGRSGRRWPWWTGGAIFLAGLAYITFDSAVDPDGGPRAAQTFEVTRRSFDIVLQEKGELEAVQSVDVKCQVEGKSTIIWIIPEGTSVEKGELLVRLASNEIDDRIRAEEISVQKSKAAAEASDKDLEIAIDQHASDVRKAEQALRTAELELEKYLKGDSELMRLEKELEVEKARRLLAQAEEIFEDSQQLNSNGFITERELSDDSLKLYEAEINLKKAIRDLETFGTYTFTKDSELKLSARDEAIKDLERTKKKAEAEEVTLKVNRDARWAEYELTQDRLDKLIDQRAKTELVAPSAGLVVYDTGGSRWDRREISEGAQVHENQSLIKLPNPSQMKVKLRVHESKTSMLALGQRASVTVEGFPGQEFRGEVSKIASVADSQNSWLNPDMKEYDTEVILDVTPEELRPGVTARARILVQRVHDALAIPVQAVFTQRQTYVFVGSTPTTAEPVAVTLGPSNRDFVEIVEGLREGDIVMLAATEQMLSLLPDPQRDSNQTEESLETSSSAEHTGVADKRGSSGGGSSS